MKKGMLLVMLCIVGVAVFSASAVWAGGADNKTNWSAEYIRTLNRNAATDAADIVMYNPAGVMMMENGLYGNISVHYIAKNYNNKITGLGYDQTDLDSDEPSLVPGIFAVYKDDVWSGYFGVSNVIGGGKVKFDDGNASTLDIGLGLLGYANYMLALGGAPDTLYYTTISNQSLEAEAVGLGYTFGGAYKFNDMFSVSLGLRYVDSNREAKGSITISPTNSVPGVNDPLTADVAYEESADGVGFILGVDIAPSDKLNIGIHYDSQVDLEYTQTINRDTLGVLGPSGQKYDHNLPGILAMGVSYKFSDNLRAEADLTYYLNDSANDYSIADNGFDLGVMVEYGFSETLRGSLGYLYTNTGVDDPMYMTPELPELDASTLGAGVVWEASPGLDVNFSLGHVFYQSESFTVPEIATTIEYEKDITFLALGFQYKFF